MLKKHFTILRIGVRAPSASLTDYRWFGRGLITNVANVAGNTFDALECTPLILARDNSVSIYIPMENGSMKGLKLFVTFVIIGLH